MGTKRSILTDQNGPPLAVVLSGANTHDVKLLVRYEKKAANYLTLVQFACAVIAWRKILLVH